MTDLQLTTWGPQQLSVPKNRSHQIQELMFDHSKLQIQHNTT